MNKYQSFVNSHWKPIVAMFVAIIVATGWQVATVETAIKKAKNGQVAGVADTNSAVIENEKNTQQIITYQAGLKNSVANYFQQRALAGGDTLALTKAIDQTKNEILALSVPNEYKELHLKVVTTLDLEKSAAVDNSMEDTRATEKAWEEILQQYFWLNN
jgi:hypothetical protein